MIQNVEEFVYALSIIKSPHSPKPHVHPVKVYYGIRGIFPAAAIEVIGSPDEPSLFQSF